MTTQIRHRRDHASAGKRKESAERRDMLYALTVRKLKPGALEDFKKADELVESVGANGVYEVLEERSFG
jgi:hypothetical protein